MIIANRSLKLCHMHSEIEVLVRVYAPEFRDDDWSCKYEIGWPQGTREGCAFGIDSAQALFVALQKIGTEIYASDYHQSGNLMWSERARGYGFPVPQNLRDLLVGEDAKTL